MFVKNVLSSFALFILLVIYRHIPGVLKSSQVSVVYVTCY